MLIVALGSALTGCSHSTVNVSYRTPGVYVTHETVHYVPQSGAPRDVTHDVETTVGPITRSGGVVRQSTTSTEDNGHLRVSNWEFTARSGAVVDEREPADGTHWTNSPPLEYYDFPLRPGRHWSIRSSTTVEYPKWHRKTDISGTITITGRDSDTVGGVRFDVVDIHSEMTTQVTEIDDAGHTIGSSTVRRTSDSKLDPVTLRTTSYTDATTATGTDPRLANYTETRVGHAFTTRPAT